MILLAPTNPMQVLKKNIDYLRAAICVSNKNKRVAGDAVTTFIAQENLCATRCRQRFDDMEQNKRLPLARNTMKNSTDATNCPGGNDLQVLPAIYYCQSATE